ncbi:uncharacterized protein EV420DRAFT_1192488 [Desarmillaria tabescens]|uniref:Secreted protein n=1 Tax=Armillaria tabescens TaxID=1929756 RepID=A0AA39NBD7_ARMTA|nr:uncharacterized protein EV420DRAFT_1192488 [Desarmillaria tabescens]KAK0462512.1 hypothetical protein EV420DRAFT_1192488 [Desarmillaria tabescens]
MHPLTYSALLVLALHYRLAANHSRHYVRPRYWKIKCLLACTKSTAAESASLHAKRWTRVCGCCDLLTFSETRRSRMSYLPNGCIIGS